jgi:geranylgeranyl diphosphate synthase, type II
MLVVMNLEKQLEPIIHRIDLRLAELLPKSAEAPAELHEAMHYSCLAPGKRLRPALVLTCAEAVGGDLEASMDVACAVEMIHCFSLIHDDLPAIDNDDLRRGRPTCHVKFGEAIAILAGDALFALAFETVANVKSDPIQVVECLKILTKSVGTYGLVGGETIDVLSEGKQITKETLELIHNRKTASLIAASCELGAVMAPQQNIKHRECLRKYGECIGLAFQIADDVLNETSTAEQLGKAVGSDRERNKATYPSFYGIEESREKALALAEEAISLVEGFPNFEILRGIAVYSVQRLK